MYEITLSGDERKALGFVGHRYEHGSRLESVLLAGEWDAPGEWGWLEDGPITIRLPEHMAWEVREIADACENRWDLLGPDLAAKLSGFCDGIV